MKYLKPSKQLFSGNERIAVVINPYSQHVNMERESVELSLNPIMITQVLKAAGDK